MIQKKLSALFNIRPGEHRLVALMLIYAFFMGLPALPTETASYTLFLVAFDAQAIPYLYIGFAIITTISGIVYTYLEKRIAFGKIMTGNLILLIISLLGFRILLDITSASWPIAALAIWYDTGWALANLGFWSMASRLLNVQQGKRLFALIGVGLTLSETLIGFVIPFLVQWVGIKNLLLISSASFSIALMIQTYMLHLFADQIFAPDYTNDESDESAFSLKTTLQTTFGDLFSKPYIRLIFTFATLYILSYYVLDNAFYIELENYYSDPEQLASFLGVFFGTAGILTMVIGAFVSGQVIYKYGVRLGLLTMPTTLLGCIALLIFTETFFESIELVFWLIIITKFINEILAYTINRAAWQVLYEPLPSNQRLRAQTVVESMVKPSAGGMAGLILLGLDSLVGFSTLQLGYLLLVILIIWIGVVLLLNRYYLSSLLQTLTQRRFRTNLPFAPDRSTITALEQGLNSSHPGVVMFALNLLEEFKPDIFPLYLKQLLHYPNPKIRLEALNRIERWQITDLIPVIKQRLQIETNDQVWGTSLRTLGVLDGPNLFDELTAYLESPNPPIKLGAMVGLLHHQTLPTPYLTLINHQLTILAYSKDPQERILAAKVIGSVTVYRFLSLLKQLLQDKVIKVRRTALRSARNLNHPELWPLIIENLNSPQTQTLAVSALGRNNQAIIPELEKAFLLWSGQPQVIMRLVQACGQIGGKATTALLFKQYRLFDESIQHQILLALNQGRYQAPTSATTYIETRMKTEIKHSTRVIVSLLDLKLDKDCLILYNALRNSLTRHQTRLLLWLSFLYDSESIDNIQNILRLKGDISFTLAEYKAYALETLSLILPLHLKRLILPIFDYSLSSTQSLRQLDNHFPQQRLTSKERIVMILTADDGWLDPWSKACALHLVAELELTELTSALEKALHSPYPIIAETAICSLFKLNPTLFHHHAPSLVNHPNPDIVQLTQWLQTEQTGVTIPMLSLIEKVLFLKEVSIFAETPETILANVGSILTELRVNSGETIITKGQPASSLYIIVDGQVRVHDNELTLGELGPGDVFGELALLDTGLRSATVTATQSVRLLRLEQTAFYDLMTDHIEVAQGVIRVLTQQVRTLTQQLVKHNLSTNLIAEVNPNNVAKTDKEIANF